MKKKAIFSKIKRKQGLPPGSLVYTGKAIERTESQLFAFNGEELRILPISHLAHELESSDQIWVDVRGLDNIDDIANIGKLLRMHALAIEDVLNTHQRTKLEEYPEGLFFVAHFITWNEDRQTISSEQIALHWNENHVASFQEIPDNTFQTIIERLQDTTKKIRKSSPDYLAYVLIDFIVDSYFMVLDSIAEHIAEIQDGIDSNSNLSEVSLQISALRSILSKLRRTILPLREALGKLNRNDMRFIQPDNQIYFRDTHDHVGQIIDYLENLYEDINNVHELYTSEMNTRQNQVTKLLTMISTIFIPLSFVAGVYGMNFTNMPELRTENGYYVTLSLMLFLAIGMLIYFKVKKWL